MTTEAAKELDAWFTKWLLVSACVMVACSLLLHWLSMDTAGDLCFFAAVSMLLAVLWHKGYHAIVRTIRAARAYLEEDT